MMKPDLLILLGSGATVPAIPGMATVTDHLLNWRNYLAPNKKGSLRPKVSGAGDKRATFFEYIKQRLPKSDSTYNFEQLIGCVEALTTAFTTTKQAPETWAGNPYFVSPISPFVRPRAGLTENSELWEVREASHYEVLRLVSEACDEVWKSKNPHPLAQGLKKLSKHFTLRIFSLNYDDIPYESELNFETGYKRLYDGFVPSLLFQPSDRHLHLQLHGSVLFGPDLRGKAMIPLYQSRAEARDNWKPGSEVGPGPDGLVRLALPMITGLRKPDAAMWEPFGTYAAVFRLFASLTPNWLIIGYGGGDSHINSVLESATLDRVLNPRYQSTPLKVVVVEYQPISDEVLLDLVPDDPVGRVVISRLFSKWANIDFQSPESSPFLRYGTTVGSKRFNRITSRIHISFDGTDWAMTDGIKELISLFRKPWDSKPQIRGIF